MTKRKDSRVSTYQRIEEARRILDLPERASMATIKESYRALLRRWHPDTCSGDRDQCLEMTRRITSAYTIIAAYCNDYEFSFARDEVSRYCSAEEWWANRFSDIPW